MGKGGQACGCAHSLPVCFPQERSSDTIGNRIDRLRRFHRKEGLFSRDGNQSRDREEAGRRQRSALRRG
jgi:hypothetical protein